jgi:hypothetical protein
MHKHVKIQFTIIYSYRVIDVIYMEKRIEGDEENVLLELSREWANRKYEKIMAKYTYPQYTVIMDAKAATVL